jgi:hypothetical protein
MPLPFLAGGLFKKFTMNVWEIQVWQLSETMRSHLAWYLDEHTCIGYITVVHIANCHGKHGSSTLLDVLKFGGLTPQQAKIHANKIMKFKHGVIKIKKLI